MKPARLILWALLAAFASAAPVAAAEIVPLGPERTVNLTTRSDQHTPALASLGAAGMVAVWGANEFEGTGIKARLLDTSGTPASEEIWVVRQGFIEAFPGDHGPRVAGADSGLYVVVWRLYEGGVWARRFLRDQPLGDAFQVGTGYAPEVAMDAAGNFVVVWLQRRGQSSDYTLLARRYGGNGLPLEEAVQVNQSRIPDSSAGPEVALHADGSFLVTWATDRIMFRRFDGPSQSWPAEGSLGFNGYRASPALYPEGDGVVVWEALFPDRHIEARRVGAAGMPSGDVIMVSPSLHPSLRSVSGYPAVALDKAGNALAVWDRDGKIVSRLFDRFWGPLSDAIQIDSGQFPVELPVVAASPSGGFTVLWSSGFRGFDHITGVPTIAGRDGDGIGVAGRSLSSLCSEDAGALCLGPGGRFAARVSWRLPSGEEGKGRPLALTRDTGAFWFFGAENLELMVKVLDGRGHNGSFWVYAAALSDVEYALVVRDTVTGEEKTYSNPQGRLASRSDVDAFPTPGAPAPDAASAFAAAESLSLGASGRFQVAVEFLDPRNGLLQKATAIPLTGDTGAFWFFDARNIELMIKILDGRGHNGHFWVYYGALSDVRYTITVTDTATEEKRTYENAPGRLVSRSDVDAFPLP